MPSLKPNFSYEISNRYVTETGEGKIDVVLKYNNIVETDGETINTIIDVAGFKFGVGINDPNNADVEKLLYDAVPEYFIG
jgi:hypothetical protein